MDEARLARYVTPPTFLFGSVLLYGYWSSPYEFSAFVEYTRANGEMVLGLTAASLFPIGFLLTTCSGSIRRALCWKGRTASPRWSESIRLSREAWNRVSAKLGVPNAGESDEFESLATIYDHTFVEPLTGYAGVRLWTAHIIASGSLFAVLISLPIGWFTFGQCPDGKFLFAWLSVSLLLGSAACRLWDKHMAFLSRSFQIFPLDVDATKAGQSEDSPTER